MEKRERDERRERERERERERDRARETRKERECAVTYSLWQIIKALRSYRPPLQSLLYTGLRDNLISVPGDKEGRSKQRRRRTNMFTRPCLLESTCLLSSLSL